MYIILYNVHMLIFIFSRGLAGGGHGGHGLNSQAYLRKSRGAKIEISQKKSGRIILKNFTWGAAIMRCGDEPILQAVG